MLEIQPQKVTLALIFNWRIFANRCSKYGKLKTKRKLHLYKNHCDAVSALWQELVQSFIQIPCLVGCFSPLPPLFFCTVWKLQCRISDSKPTETRIMLQPLKTIQIYTTGFPTFYSRCFWTSKEWHLFTAQSWGLWNLIQHYFLWYLEYMRTSF